jgi:hypothetical protein
MANELILELVKAGAVLGSAGVAGYFGWKNTKLNKSLQMQKDRSDHKDDVIISKDAILRLTKQMKTEQAIREEVRKLLDTTPIDRVLGFQAVNGLYKPERTSLIFDDMDSEYRSSLGNYNFFPIDTTYQDHLYTAEKNGFEFVNVAELPTHDQMKGVYMVEGVKQSLWMVAGRVQLTEKKAMVIYFSFSTHSDKDINTPELISKCQAIIHMFEYMINTQVVQELSCTN